MPGRAVKEGDSELDIRVTCKCPRCGKLFERVLPWTGRGIPRIRCRDCCHHFSHVVQVDDIPDHGPPQLSRWARMGWV